MKKLLVILLTLFATVALADRIDKEDFPKHMPPKTDFYKEIYPIFLNNCASCHNVNTPSTNWLDEDVATDNKGLIYNRVYFKGDMPASLKYFSWKEKEILRKWLLREEVIFDGPVFRPVEPEGPTK